MSLNQIIWLLFIYIMLCTQIKKNKYIHAIKLNIKNQYSGN